MLSNLRADIQFLGWCSEARFQKVERINRERLRVKSILTWLQRAILIPRTWPIFTQSDSLFVLQDVQGSCETSGSEDNDLTFTLNVCKYIFLITKPL